MTGAGRGRRAVADRLVVRAIELAMGAAQPVEVRARALAAAAGGDLGALEQAARRIEWGHLQRPSRHAAAASAALRHAAALADQPTAAGTAPTGS